MPVLVITRGLPGSGKSTWARQWVSQDPAHRAEVNRDSLRLMMHGGYADGKWADQASIPADRTRFGAEHQHRFPGNAVNGHVDPLLGAAVHLLEVQRDRGGELVSRSFFFWPLKFHCQTWSLHLKEHVFHKATHASTGNSAYVKQP